MTLYRTDKRTGEMTELLAPLHRKPRGKVKRLPSRHVRSHQTTYRPRGYYRRPRPLNDALGGLAACILALAVLSALAH